MKSDICSAVATIVGHCCTYEGHIPDPLKVDKILNWPTPTNVSEVHRFLGTCGVLRVFIKDYSKLAQPLVRLTKHNVEWVWGEDEQGAMEVLKAAVVNSPTLQPIDYECGRMVIVAVDSLIIGVGFVVFQEGQDGKRYPARFGSINWNKREARFLQPKIELYGLLCALYKLKEILIGLALFIVVMDASFIIGMINNPDLIPGAAANRWIAGILLFDFDLVHVPAPDHMCPDGLSRRALGPGEKRNEEAEEVDQWIDEKYGFFYR